MNNQLKAARDEMNDSQGRCFDLVYNAHPGTVTNYTLATEGCLSYTARISEVNVILREHGWEIYCQKPRNTVHKNTRLYSIREWVEQPELIECHESRLTNSGKEFENGV